MIRVGMAGLVLLALTLPTNAWAQADDEPVTFYARAALGAGLTQDFAVTGAKPLGSVGGHIGGGMMFTRDFGVEFLLEGVGAGDFIEPRYPLGLGYLGGHLAGHSVVPGSDRKAFVIGGGGFGFGGSEEGFDRAGFNGIFGAGYMGQTTTTPRIGGAILYMPRLLFRPVGIVHSLHANLIFLWSIDL